MSTTGIVLLVLWLALYGAAVVWAVVESRRPAVSRRYRLVALAAPYGLVLLPPFLWPPVRSIEEVMRAAPFALVYLVLTALVVYGVKRQWRDRDQAEGGRS